MGKWNATYSAGGRHETIYGKRLIENLVNKLKYLKLKGFKCIVKNDSLFWEV